MTNKTERPMIDLNKLTAFYRPDYDPKTIQETPIQLRTLIRYETGIMEDSGYGFGVVFIDDMTGFLYETTDTDMTVGQVVKTPEGEIVFQYYV